jgi:hypothetical protein
MKLETRIKVEYRKWCKDVFPDYRVKDFPCQGRMYEVWEASWYASARFFKEEAMKYVVRNHNGTILGVFKTKRSAEKEAKEYRYQTGNVAYIEKEEV